MQLAEYIHRKIPFVFLQRHFSLRKKSHQGLPHPYKPGVFQHRRTINSSSHTSQHSCLRKILTILYIIQSVLKGNVVLVKTFFGQNYYPVAQMVCKLELFCLCMKEALHRVRKICCIWLQHSIQADLALPTESSSRFHNAHVESSSFKQHHRTSKLTPA